MTDESMALIELVEKQPKLGALMDSSGDDVLA
jgi:hypothetical protein